MPLSKKEVFFPPPRNHLFLHGVLTNRKTQRGPPKRRPQQVLSPAEPPSRAGEAQSARPDESPSPARTSAKRFIMSTRSGFRRRERRSSPERRAELSECSQRSWSCRPARATTSSTKGRERSSCSRSTRHPRRRPGTVHKTKAEAVAAQATEHKMIRRFLREAQTSRRCSECETIFEAGVADADQNGAPRCPQFPPLAAPPPED